METISRTGTAAVATTAATADATQVSKMALKMLEVVPRKAAWIDHRYSKSIDLGIGHDTATS